MQKVDRLGWTDGLIFKAYGTRFGIRTNNNDVLKQMQGHLPLGWEPDSEPVVDMLYSLRVGGQSKQRGRRYYNLLYMGAGRIARTLDMGEIFETLADNLQTVSVLLAQDYLFLRAGAAGWQGQAILLPGADVGTTTLLTALLKAGATYYGDFYTLLDPEGNIHPYLTPLMVRDDSGENASRVPVEEVGGISGREPLPLGLVAWLEYAPGARWRPRLLTPGRSVLELLQSTMAARRPDFALPILGQAVTRARLIKSKRGEAEATVRPLLGQLSSV